ncbi:MAG: Ornithine carbamoyltransferase, anabolic [Myxococcota bacterium]|nr:Ornithine carbamoyltransferase, anabolic [Myxococcota bacterium]
MKGDSQGSCSMIGIESGLETPNAAKTDLVDFIDWPRADLDELMVLAERLKARRRAGELFQPLRGKTLGMIFEKSSTRTRVSFEVGMFQLGGHAIMLSSRDTQLGRGEPMQDTARVLSRYVDAVMVRTFSQVRLEELARFSTIPVINGLTDLTHPCQVLADIFTMRERFGRISGLEVAWIGDGNNMCNSWINAAGIWGFRLRIACPPSHQPLARYMETARSRSPGCIEITSDPAAAARGAHVINTDVWASMGQEEEEAVRARDFAGFQVNRELVELADPAAMVMHCLPAHRGQEITEEVLEGPRSAVWDEAENRLHIQKAILVRLIEGIRAIA